MAGYLDGIRVLELADELGEYAGKVLAGLGASVVKIEPPEGEGTRRIGPFVDDVVDPERSLHFWHYNAGKRSVVLDLDTEDGQRRFRALAGSADVVLDTRPRGWMRDRGIDAETVCAHAPRLIWTKITPFGEDGPWASFAGSDLVHLALGGVAMNCGYDPDTFGRYDTPPVAPQMWQASHIVGEVAVMSIMGALHYRRRTGTGQIVSANVHEAVSKNTETDLPDWIFLRQEHRRLTCRHSMVSASAPALSPTKDGRYLLPYRTYLNGAVTADSSGWTSTVRLLTMYDMASDIPTAPPADAAEHRRLTEVLSSRVDELISRNLFDRDLWRDAQTAGLPWAPVRRPDENVADEHWWSRGTFADIWSDEIGRSTVQLGSKWYSEDAEWSGLTAAPRLGADTDSLEQEWAEQPPGGSDGIPLSRAHSPSPLGMPFALDGVRIIDLSWMLASAGAGRFLAALGAEVIKIEHDSRLDGMRNGLGKAPLGGRAERDRAEVALPTPPSAGPNRSGAFMEINAGKLGMSLNLKSPEGKRILEELIRGADMVVEGYSPGTLNRMGFGYERLKELNPSIIYVQQSGFGEHGSYGPAKAFGPTAQAITGISDMSGLPSPYPPAGWGYSYLDWFGAYNMANAMLAALYRRDSTGLGCHIDASQGEAGLHLTGTAVLDWSVNGRPWSRYGNRSPYKQAAPSGIFPTKGEDRWIAVSVFTDEQWNALADELGVAAAEREELASLAQRLAAQDRLEALVAEATRDRDGRALMSSLQARGVPAGVCQTAEDRYEHDPQLAHLKWLTELDQTEIGRWPVKEYPARLSASPAYIGGRLDRSGPNYGEDTDDVLARILLRSADEIAALRSLGVV